MKKIFFISSILITSVVFAFVVQGSVHAAAGDGKGYINIYGSGPINPACDPDQTDCSSKHPFAKNCNTQSKSCSSQSVDIPSDVRPIWKFVCEGLPSNKECAQNGTNNGSSGSMSIGNPGCGKTVQLDAYDPGKGPGNPAVDYLVYYTGDCAPATATATATQTPTASVTQGPACGSTCTTSADCTQSPTNSCTACINGTCQPPTTVTEPPVTGTITEPPVTEPPVTATPTPEFNPAMCACNGTSVSSLVPGAQATVTANYQIVGEDQTKATMNNVTFVMYKGDNTSGKAILHSDPIPVAITSLNNERTQYQAQWTFTVPTDVDPNVVYRVTTASDCKATGLSQTSMNVQVAGVSTGPTSQPQKKAQSQSFWTTITSFFESLFGLNKQAATTSTQSMTPTPTKEPVYTTQGNQLQIGKLTPPAKILPQTACNILRFEFSK